MYKIVVYKNAPNNYTGSDTACSQDVATQCLTTYDCLDRFFEAYFSVKQHCRHSIEKLRRATQGHELWSRKILCNLMQKFCGKFPCHPTWITGRQCASTNAMV